jgi:DNA-binding Xre family transcriptional regulator
MPEIDGPPTMPGLNLAAGTATAGHLSAAAVLAADCPSTPSRPVSLASAGRIPPARPQATILDGRRLRQLRRQRGLSQEKLADRAGISITTVARLERQSSASCRGRTLGRLAAALGEQPATIARTEPDREAAGPSPSAPGHAGQRTLPQAHIARGRDE